MVVRTPSREKKIDPDEVVKCGMECEICRDWFHTKCEGVGQKDYKKMKEMEKLIWMCKKCKRSLKEVSERNRKLSDENKKLKEDNRELKRRIDDLKERMRSLKKRL